MSHFAVRRCLAMGVTALAAAAVGLLCFTYGPTLRDAAYVSGWMLFGMVVVLTLFNLRKKWAYPPLLSASTWLQIHIYLGLLAAFVFLLHIGLSVPNGPFEVTLAALFLLVALSGVFGIVVSRVLPARLTAQGEMVLFERIPMFVRGLRERAEALAVASVQNSETTTLADFYWSRLADYFARPRPLARFLYRSANPAQRLTEELHAYERYLDEQEQSAAHEMADLVLTKDNLDAQHALQGVLKGWLFVHIPLTYALIVFMGVHAVVAHTFVGRAA